MKVAASRRCTALVRAERCDDRIVRSQRDVEERRVLGERRSVDLDRRWRDVEGRDGLTRLCEGGAGDADALTPILIYTPSYMHKGEYIG